MTFGPYPATIVKVHDGDTCTTAIDLGFGVTFTSNCRIYGIDAAELDTAAGKAAAAYAQGLLLLGAKVTVISHGYDKYGNRYDGEIKLSDGRDFGSLMLEAGLAVPYDGHGAKA